MDSQVTAVLTRRIASLERVLGAISETRGTVGDDDDNVGNTTGNLSQPPLDELRALDRHLSELVPPEFTRALSTLRAYRQSLARTYVLECQQRNNSGNSNTNKKRGIWEIRDLKSSLDDTHELESLLHCTKPLRTLQNTARDADKQAAGDQEKIDQLLSQYNASIAYSNASILRLAAVIRDL